MAEKLVNSLCVVEPQCVHLQLPCSAQFTPEYAVAAGLPVVHICQCGMRVNIKHDAICCHVGLPQHPANAIVQNCTRTHTYPALAAMYKPAKGPHLCAAVHMRP